MTIHVYRDGNSFGPYTEEQVKKYLEVGVLIPTDMALAEGGEEWRTLAEIGFVPLQERLQEIAFGAHKTNPPYQERIQNPAEGANNYEPALNTRHIPFCKLCNTYVFPQVVQGGKSGVSFTADNDAGAFLTRHYFDNSLIKVCPYCGNPVFTRDEMKQMKADK